ncbi:MAG: HAMP domain-containing histidine kinase [Lachnospiraceae bacterium]|nr:HAMP domain-containing histidine kinase [Lachnospiraceae bacterium]
MKLRSRIILISCVIFFCISLISNIIILLLMNKSFLQEAESKALGDAIKSFSDVETKVEEYTNRIDDDVLKYILKKQNDDYIICTRESRELGLEKKIDVFNNTIFDAEFLGKLKFSDLREDLTNLYAVRFRWEGRLFLLYNCNITNSYQVYKLEDITYAQTKTRLLGFFLALLTVCSTIMESVLISVLLKKALKPLQRLGESAQQIACGRYDQRVEVYRDDEVGILSGHFNKMAEAVEQRTKNLEESERKKTLFMGNLTHELKTPLTAISGYAESLLFVKLSEADREEALGYIYSESHRLERLSKKMMNLLLLEETEHIEFQTVPAKELFEAAKIGCSKLLAERHMILECRENGEEFYVDSDLMTDVLINLVDNAVKASEDGAKIQLLAEPGKLMVQDFGKGIPAEEKDKILEPFYMIDKSRSRKSGSAGLGLAITAQILQRHSCTLSIESEVSKGTCMILQFV